MRRSLITGLFGLSGACALIYQLLWLRMFSGVFGVTLYATTAVIAAFMGGLALGSWLVGSWLDRHGSPLRVYAFLELGIGAYALALPHLVAALVMGYGIVHAGIGEWQMLTLAVRFVVSVLVLGVPTVLMGGTLPAMVQYFSPDPERTGSEAGRLYAVNTIGAVLGAMVGGLILLPALGVSSLNVVAAGTNLVIGAFCLVLARSAPAAPDSRSVPRRSSTHATAGGWALVVIGLSGFAGLGYEIVWMRVLAILTTDTIFAFTCTLGTFLLGIALGSRGGVLLIGRGVGFLGLAVLQLGLAAYALASPFLLRVVVAGVLGGEMAGPDAAAAMAARSWVELAVFRQTAAAGLVLLVPSCLLGASTTVAFAIHARATRSVASGTGRVYASNTIGALLGTIVVGLILVPSLGSSTTLLVLAAVSLGAGVLAARCAGTVSRTSRDARRTVVAATGAIACVVVALAFAGDLFFTQRADGREVLVHTEDATGLVEVLQDRHGVRQLVVDRTQAWGTTAPLMVHATRHQGYLPLLLHPAPESVVEIGLATGISFAPALLYDGVRRAEMVEISPAVIAAAVRFREDNADLAAHPKLTLVVDDGRNHLRYTRQRYDVIVLGLFVPYRPSAGYLFSREFYGICKDRLTAGGFVIQWLPLDQLTPDALRSVMHTFQGVFGDVHAFERDHYLALIGGAPLRFDVDAIAQRMHDPSIASDLTHHGLTDPHGVLASYMMGPAEIAAFAGDAPENTENSLTVEFQRLRIGAYRHAVENLEALLAHRVFPEVGDPGASPESLDRLRRAFEGRTHTLRGAVAQARGRHEDARQHFRRAVQLNPRDVRARAQLKYYEQRRPER